MVRWTMLALALVACGGGEDDSGLVVTTDDGGGQCGAVTTHNLTIRAMVVDVDSQPVQGAELRLVEDTWDPQEKLYGTGVTDASGRAEFEARDVTAVEDCWGVALNYTLKAQLGNRSGEDSYNSSLFTAINSDTNIVDTTSFPVVIQ